MPPNYARIEQLHRDYAPTEAIFAKVFVHCCIVRDIAVQIIETEKLSLEQPLVEVACLLHDIGVYKLYDVHGQRTGQSYMLHGLLGYDLLHHEGFDEQICRFAIHHIGVGFTQDDVKAQKLPLPLRDYMPTTVEERLVLYADKFHTKDTHPVFNTYESYYAFALQYGSHFAKRLEVLAKEFGNPDLGRLASKYGQTLR